MKCLAGGTGRARLDIYKNIARVLRERRNLQKDKLAGRKGKSKSKKI